MALRVTRARLAGFKDVDRFEAGKRSLLERRRVAVELTRARKAMVSMGGGGAADASRLVSQS